MLNKKICCGMAEASKAGEPSSKRQKVDEPGAMDVWGADAAEERRDNDWGGKHYFPAFDTLQEAVKLSFSDAIASLSSHCSIAAVAKTLRGWRAEMDSPLDLAGMQHADDILAIKAYFLPIEGQRSMSQICDSAIKKDDLVACLPFLRSLCTALERLNLPVIENGEGEIWVSLQPDDEHTYTVEGSAIQDHLWIAPKCASLDQVSSPPRCGQHPTLHRSVAMLLPRLIATSACVQPQDGASGGRLYKVRTMLAYDVAKVSPELGGRCLLPPVTCLTQLQAGEVHLGQVPWKAFKWSQRSAVGAHEPMLPLPTLALTPAMEESIENDDKMLTEVIGFGQKVLRFVEPHSAVAGLSMLTSELSQRLAAARQVQKDRKRLHEASCLAFSNDGLYFGYKGTKKDVKDVLHVSCPCEWIWSSPKCTMFRMPIRP